MAVTSRLLSTMGTAVAAAIAVGLAGSAGAQQPSSPQAQAGGGQQGTLAQIRTLQQSPQLPQTEVLCRGLRNAADALVRCVVRFDAVTNVATVRAVNPDDTQQRWTAFFQAFDPRQDDTAFLLLVESSGPNRAATLRQATRDLADVFSKIGPRQRVAVAGFSTSFRLTQDFTSQPAAIREGLSEVTASQGAATELYNNVREAISRLEQVPAGRRVLVIAGTGRTDDTAVTTEAVEAAAERAGVRIVTLGYAERDADAPSIQTLERLSSRTGGASYRVPVRQRTLPDDFRRTILTRYGSGGVVEAALPNAALPRQLDITLTHADNRVSSFAAIFASTTGGDGADTMTTLSLPGSVNEVASFLGADPVRTGLIGAGVLALVILGVVLLRGRRRQAPPSTSSLAFPVPRPSSDAVPVPPDAAAPPAYTPPPAPAPQPPPGPRGEPSPHAPATEVIARAPEARPEPKAEPIAFLEFNGPPGRVPLFRQYVTIGRLASNDIVTDEADLTVSREHAVLSVNVAGRLQSTNKSKESRSDNPIYVNDVEGDHVELADGDRIKLGTGTYGFVFREVRRS